MKWEQNKEHTKKKGPTSGGIKSLKETKDMDKVIPQDVIISWTPTQQ